jgi:hypothetical protein
MNDKQRQLVKSLVDRLEGNKYQFFSDLNSKIKSHVSAKKTEECLILVTTPINGGSPVKWYPTLVDPNEGLRYVYRLVAFLQQKDYYSSSSKQWYKIDSVLTEEVIQITIDSFKKFYQDNQELIAINIIAAIGMDRQIANSVAETIVKNNKFTRFASKRAQEAIQNFLINSFGDQIHEVANSLGHQIVVASQHLMTSTIVTTVTGKVVTVATYALATPAVKIMLVKYSALIMSHMGIFIGKLMAMPAIKVALTKLIGLSVVAALVKIITIKVGISVGTAVTMVVIPVLLLLLGKEWIDFPTKLGNSIADSIHKELGAEFAATNQNILEKMVENFLDNWVMEFAENIADDEEISQCLKEIKKLVEA